MEEESCTDYPLRVAADPPQRSSPCECAVNLPSLPEVIVIVLIYLVVKPLEGFLGAVGQSLWTWLQRAVDSKEDPPTSP